MKVAVVGHVEWIEFARVERVPAAGEIVAARERWEEPGGGGAVAAVQMARLTGGCRFFTALGDDPLGHRAKEELEEMGLDLAVAWREEPQRRAFVFLDAAGERTITTMGERMQPQAADPLPWDELGEADAVYVTAGDPGAVRAARAAGKLVATVRVGQALRESDVPLDALVMSGSDPGERYTQGDIEPPPLAVVRTAGASGGSLETAGGETSHWPAAPLPGPVVDSYGSGDSFAGGLTVGLGQGLPMAEALELAAQCGAACATGRGPYERQLTGA